MLSSNNEFLMVIDNYQDELEQLSDAIWEHPEIAYTEEYSAAILEDYLEKKSFQVEREIGGIKTAFSASFGKGKPVIGFLGEYDALAGLSQENGILQKKPVSEGECGHGCGHNLLGVGSLAAALAVKQYLENTGNSGTVMYFGCPAEEGGSGKAFMAREGIFNSLDIAFCWHPAELNEVMQESSLANVQVKYAFDGISAHAAENPQDGRSALDALELMNIGVNFLREHMGALEKVHYAITDTGGTSANVVQSHAESVYLIRSTDISKVYALWERVNKIAEGAAMATETKVQYKMMKACSNLVSNRVCEKQLAKSFEVVAPPEYTQEELEFASKMSETAVNIQSRAKLRIRDMQYINNAAYMQERASDALFTGVVPYEEKMYAGYLSGSTDVGDVSWCCPTAQIRTATWCAKSGGHSWQIVAQGKGSIAKKGMLYAGKIMGNAAIEFMKDPNLVAAAKEEFDVFRKENEYVMMPPEIKPAIPR